MKLVGLTGGIGSGKSTVARHFRSHGVPTVDADTLARQAVAPGSAALAKIASVFGKELLDAEGALNRPVLGTLVFRDSEARARLDEIVHPQVRRLFEVAVAQQRAAGTRLMLYELPLLFEKNLEQQFDTTIVVAVTPETQLKRVRRRDGLDAAAAQRRIDAQLPLEDKIRRADYVLWNESSEESLVEPVRELIKKMLDLETPTLTH